MSRSAYPKLQPPVRVVLFDCDGVMCPPRRFAAVLQAEFGITPEMTTAFFKGGFAPALLGHVDVLDLLPAYLKDSGWKRSREEFVEPWLTSEREVDPEMARLVGTVKARGFVTGLATNQEGRRARFMRERMGFQTLFDVCFISSELGQMKPQPGYFQSVTERLGVGPSQIAFVDDEEHYLDAAARHRWQAIHYTGSHAHLEARLARLLGPTRHTGG
jgi:putative hydrolase of the HAD superfamily